MKAIAKTASSYLPVVNCAMNFYEEKRNQVTQKKLKRLGAFCISLLKNLEKLENKINDDFIRKDEFEDIFEQTANNVMNEFREEKRLYFQNILINGITAKACSSDKTEKYLRILDNMGWIELRVLGVLNDPSKYNEDRGCIIKDPNDGYNFIGIGLSGQNSVDILTQLLDENKEEIMDALYYLEDSRLIDKQSNAIHTQSGGNPIHILDNMLTSKGKDFICFIKLE
jgi:hypothetical protein